MTILIEPLNHYNAPGYFLSGTAMAADIIREVGAPNLRMMFDFYHVQIMEGDVTRRFETMLPLVGHVQIAAVPHRGKPDHGELNYDYVLAARPELGWDKPIGAEYMPEANVEPDMKWLAQYRHWIRGRSDREVEIEGGKRLWAEKPVVGFIGLGLMGHGMAKNIRKSGYELWVRGRSQPRAYGKLAGDGREGSGQPNGYGGEMRYHPPLPVYFRSGGRCPAGGRRHPRRCPPRLDRDRHLHGRSRLDREACQ